MEVKPRILRAAALMLAGAFLATATPALADKPKPAELAEARTRYKKGLDLYQDGAFDAALIELQRAYELAPSYKILYNVALVDLQLNDFAGALKNFRQYLEEGGKKVDAKRRAEVDKEIEKLVGRVATVTISTNVDGAEVMVDDLKVGETPLDKPMLVSAGKRKITLSKDGYVSVSRVVVVAGGDAKTLELKLRTPAEAKAASDKKPATSGGTTPKHAEESPSRPVPWLWWGITGGLAAGTTVAGVLTLGAESDLDKKKQHPATKQALDDAASKTRTLAIVTDVFLVGTLAVGGYATYLTFFSDDKADPTAEKKAAWGLAVGPTSVSVAGSF
jgi:hypothetical protein